MCAHTIDEARGLEAGKSAVILSAGPSLRGVDDRVYGKYVTIAVNDAIAKFPESDYYFTADPQMLNRRHWEHVRSSKCRVGVAVGLFSNDWLRAPSLEQNGIDGDRVYECAIGDAQVRNLAMTQEDRQLLVGCSSQVAVHFAVIMGCTTIYLVGCDCCLVDGCRYFWHFEDEPFVGGFVHEDPVRLKALREEGEDGQLEGFVVAQWNGMRQSCSCATLIDASGGLLASTFPTCSIEELFA